MVDRRGEEEQFTADHISQCMKKVIAVDLKQTVQVDKDLQIRAYYAGHVLGAAMFYAKVGDGAILYTGDYNMTPDRHLGAAQIDRLQLDLLITESTYATTIRDSKYAREREFLKAVCIVEIYIHRLCWHSSLLIYPVQWRFIILKTN
uniref:Cleavage and polyadenylation specificity factor subunit 3-II isoform X1 n=1 Tax=Rhizophora mucronata TaxID=61149 RepID=A0A2P2KNF1_RHIMU